MGGVGDVDSMGSADNKGIPTSSKHRMGRSSQIPNILAKRSGMGNPNPNKG